METTQTSREKNLWDDLRDSVRGGVRDLQIMGDELARQGRLRMDIFQTERRLRSAFEALGEATHHRLERNLNVSNSDPTVSELTTRIRYYETEIERLREEQRKTGDASA